MYATRSFSGGCVSLPGISQSRSAPLNTVRSFGGSFASRSGTYRTGRSAWWPTSARNRSRNPALARNGTTNRTPAWSISRIVLGCPIAESHTINNPGPEI